MNQYDIVFVGHFGIATIVPFNLTTFTDWGGPVFHGPLAASCLSKRIATISRMAEHDRALLQPLEAAGIDLFVREGETAHFKIIYPGSGVDERQLFLTVGGGCFSMDDMPPIEPCLIHLGGLSPREFSMEFMRALKTAGFRMSIDAQSFVWQVDEWTRLIHLEDIPEKQEILGMIDFIKLDITEAKALTGTDVLQDQADMLERWGSQETVITCSDGAFARSNGKTSFAKFTNRTVQGRTGRGDTFAGAYLARRLDRSVEESLRFAAALTSIKIESPGAFNGSLGEVIERMNEPFSLG
jgi:sugar/nucleoside kinase (ribokinase family)